MKTIGYPPRLPEFRGVPAHELDYSKVDIPDPALPAGLIPYSIVVNAASLTNWPADCAECANWQKSSLEEAAYDAVNAVPMPATSVGRALYARLGTGDKLGKPAFQALCTAIAVGCAEATFRAGQWLVDGLAEMRNWYDDDGYDADAGIPKDLDVGFRDGPCRNGTGRSLTLYQPLRILNETAGIQNISADANDYESAADLPDFDAFPERALVLELWLPIATAYAEGYTRGKRLGQTELYQWYLTHWNKEVRCNGHRFIVRRAADAVCKFLTANYENKNKKDAGVANRFRLSHYGGCVDMRRPSDGRRAFPEAASHPGFDHWTDVADLEVINPGDDDWDPAD